MMHLEYSLLVTYSIEHTSFVASEGISNKPNVSADNQDVSPQLGKNKQCCKYPVCLIGENLFLADSSAEESTLFSIVGYTNVD